ncbi:MAG: TetR/AcrR family transcriptional regulator [Ornithinibacter sp.]
MPAPVKTRRYDATTRRAQAESRREAILAAARDLMLRDGYAATTIGSIATAAAVSAETIYKAFAGKPGLVRALYQQALEGAGREPAEQRSNRLRETATGHELVAGWAELAREVAPHVAPLAILLRDAAVLDPGARSLVEEMEHARLLRMRNNARALRATGDVRPGLSQRDIADTLYAVSSSEMFELLVMRRGWSSKRFARFQRQAIGALLIPHNSSSEPGQQP